MTDTNENEKIIAAQRENEEACKQANRGDAADVVEAESKALASAGLVGVTPDTIAGSRAAAAADGDIAYNVNADGNVTGDGTEAAPDGSGGGDEGYGSYTVSELKDELDSRGVEYASDDLKADLVAKLESDDGSTPQG